ncbi:probable serine/threonine-protein kinase clkA [Danaus plexippus]|uniref:probable serine/threonine-protein kinase clkA n=1 Tax=Danaus plexippus TaxID=13037 RepID=UPI002AB2BD61|nr:probable serine/threonine-protein kinase clkA [Danaus plexippus]
MLLALVVVAALVNIIAKTNNFNIKTSKYRDFDVRVRRHADIDSVLFRRIVDGLGQGDIKVSERTKAIGDHEIVDRINFLKKSKPEQSLEGKERRASNEIEKYLIKNEEGDGFHSKNVIDPKTERVKRHASLGSGIGSFFSNIYNKMYDLTHSHTKNQTHSPYTDFNIYNNASYNLNNHPLYNYSANNNFPAKPYSYHYTNSYSNTNANNNNLANYNGPYDPYPGYNTNNYNNYYNQNAHPNNNLNNPGYTNNYSNYYSNPYSNPNGYNPYNSYPNNNLSNSNLAYNPYPGYNPNNNLNNPDYKNNYSDYANTYNQNNSNNDLIHKMTSSNNDNEDISSTTEIIINQGMILGGIGCPRNHRRVAFVCVPTHG